MDHRVELAFEYPDAEDARRVRRSVELEAGNVEGGRTRASVSRGGTVLTVTIEAADLVALRAGLNTWLTLVDVAERCARVEAV